MYISRSQLRIDIVRIRRVRLASIFKYNGADQQFAEVNVQPVAVSIQLIGK